MTQGERNDIFFDNWWVVKWKLERLLIKEEGEGGENRERRRKSLEDCMRIKYIKWFRIIIDIYLYK